jgi:protease I
MDVIIIIAQQGFQDHELERTREIFDKHNIRYDIASPTGEECIGKFESKIMPDKPLKYVENSDYRAVVLIGGSGTKDLGKIVEFNNILQIAYDNEMVIGAICSSPMHLANLGLLQGKNATVFPGTDELKAFKHGKVHLLKKDVVVEDNIITAKNEDATYEFAEEIVKLLKKK